MSIPSLHFIQSWSSKNFVYAHLNPHKLFFMFVDVPSLLSSCLKQFTFFIVNTEKSISLSLSTIIYFSSITARSDLRASSNFIRINSISLRVRITFACVCMFAANVQFLGKLRNRDVCLCSCYRSFRQVKSNMS